MYLQEIMSSYLNENVVNPSMSIDTFRPLKVEKSNWKQEEKRIIRSYSFKNKKFLEQFVVELLKYNRECDASVEVRFYKDTVGIIIHSLSPTISEIELEATRDIDKIKKDVMYYYADKQ
jgi:hypothetical protein